MVDQAEEKSNPYPSWDPNRDPRLLFTKAVDPKGNPLRLYHGTAEDLFKYFDEDILATNTGANSASKGFFFSSSPIIAKTYSHEEMDDDALSEFKKITEDIGDEIGAEDLLTRQTELSYGELDRALMKLDYILYETNFITDKGIDPIAIEEGISRADGDKIYREEIHTLKEALEEIFEYIPETSSKEEGGIPLVIPELGEGEIKYVKSLDEIRNHLKEYLEENLESLEEIELYSYIDEDGNFKLQDEYNTKIGTLVSDLKGADTHSNRLKDLQLVYLVMENPYIVDIPSRTFGTTAISDTIEKAWARGHDGVIINNIFDGRGLLTSAVDPELFLNNPNINATHYIVFDPKQIIDARTGKTMSKDVVSDDFSDVLDMTSNSNLNEKLLTLFKLREAIVKRNKQRLVKQNLGESYWDDEGFYSIASSLDESTLEHYDKIVESLTEELKELEPKAHEVLPEPSKLKPQNIDRLIDLLDDNMEPFISSYLDKWDKNKLKHRQMAISPDISDIDNVSHTDIPISFPVYEDTISLPEVTTNSTKSIEQIIQERDKLINLLKDGRYLQKEGDTSRYHTIPLKMRNEIINGLQNSIYPLLSFHLSELNIGIDDPSMLETITIEDVKDEYNENNRIERDTATELVDVDDFGTELSLAGNKSNIKIHKTDTGKYPEMVTWIDGNTRYTLNASTGEISEDDHIGAPGKPEKTIKVASWTNDKPNKQSFLINNTNINIADLMKSGQESMIREETTKERPFRSRRRGL